MIFVSGPGGNHSEGRRHNQITSGDKVVSIMALIAHAYVTVSVGSGGCGSNLGCGSTSNTMSVVLLNAGLAAVVAATIRELSDLVTAVVSVSSSRGILSSSSTNSNVINVKDSWVGKDSSALGDVFRITFKSTSTIFQCACYVN